MKTVNDLFEDNEEITEVELDKVDVSSKGTTHDIIEDYNFCREKLIKSMIRGSELIDLSVIEAKISPTARAIESASGAVKTLTDVSKSLIDLHEKIRNITQYSKNPEESETDQSLNKSSKVILKSTLSNLIQQIDDEDELRKMN